ncbi:hypothetical protein AX14_001934 [Amanita brunnescens Koide BX004]|nr:hypothetical protein AX14_001934 [Amanita brunnescens Koide BX004]
MDHVSPELLSQLDLVAKSEQASLSYSDSGCDSSLTLKEYRALVRTVADLFKILERAIQMRWTNSGRCSGKDCDGEPQVPLSAYSKLDSHFVNRFVRKTSNAGVDFLTTREFDDDGGTFNKPM